MIPLEPLSFLLILACGYGFKKGKWLQARDYEVISKIVLNFTLPIAVMHAFAALSEGSDYLLIILIGFLCALLPLLVIYLLSKRQERNQRVFAMINIAGYNIGCFGLPIIQSFFGPSAGAIACLFDIGNAMMMTGGSYALTTTLLKINGEKEDIKDMIKRIFSSIPLDTYLILLGLMILHIQLPHFLLEITKPIANANAFLAMFMLGLMLELEVDLPSVKKAVSLLIQRFAFSMVFAFLLFAFSPFDFATKRVLAVVVFAPISTLAPYYTQRCKGEEVLAAFTNSLSILSGILIMSLMQWIL